MPSLEMVVLENAGLKSTVWLYCFHLILENSVHDPLKSVYSHLHSISDFPDFHLGDRSCSVFVFILDTFL